MYAPTDLRFQSSTISSVSAEAYLVSLFEDTNLLPCTLSMLISLSKQYEREPLYFNIPNVSHQRGLIATHCTDVVPPAAYTSLCDRSLTLRVQVTLFAQYHFNAGQSFRNLGHFQQFRRRSIKPATIHMQRRSQNLVKPVPPL